MRSFGSDNHSGVHPAIMQAIIEANQHHQIAYGDDDYTQQMRRVVQQHFGPQAEPFLVFNGTGANVVSLRACVQPFNSIFMTHAALRTIPTPDGKLTPELIAPHLVNFGFEHHSQPKVVYISECTELGTVYTPEEIKALADFLHGYGMYLHLDGARIANAALFLQKSFKELTVDCGVDIMSFGATKNGLMMGEMVIAFRPELAENLKYLRKQSAQLYSKMRYAACQFIPYLENDIWKMNAANANQKAQQLRARIVETGYTDFTQKTEANILLFKLPKEKIEQLLQQTFFYVWNENTGEIRLVTSWDTTDEDVEHFIQCLKQIS